MQSSILRKTSYLLILALTITASALAHSGKPKFHVIIDTDGAVDDMRAVSMFLSGNDIRVLALTCSQGTLTPESVYGKVTGLLNYYHHEGIPVGIGAKTTFPLPAWSAFAESIIWGNAKPDNEIETATEATFLLNKVTDKYSRKLTLIALGSLKTYADWLSVNPGMKEKVERIIWYNDKSVSNGFNYKASPESFERIKQIGIPLVIVSAGNKDIPCDEHYIDALSNASDSYTRHILEICAQEPVKQMIRNKHLRLFDDLTALYLSVPLLFETEISEGISYAAPNSQIPFKSLYESIQSLLESANTGNNRMFGTFPVDPALYKKEIAAMLPSTIEKFGLQEWKAICLTNEIHGHTGIYSIIGAKAGIRALEYFNVGVNNVNVISFSGKQPPLSCFNDGLQISTGATIGQGLIEISDSLSVQPMVIFECNAQKIIMKLNPEISEQMKADIAFGIKNYGLESDKYWLYIEELALKYWSDFNRHEIFTITPL